MRAYFLLLLLCFFLLLPGRTSAAETVRVGIHASGKTLEFATVQGKATGVLVDLWTLWGEQNGQTVQFVVSQEQTMSDLLHRDRIDVVANAQPGGELVYSEPYFMQDYYLFRGKNSTLDALDRLPIRVGLLATDNHFIGHALQGRVQPQLYQRHQDILAAMRAGVLDFMIANDINLNYSVVETELIYLTYPEKTFYSYPVRAAALAENQALITAFNDGLSKLAPGEIESIRNRWMQSTVGYRLPWQLIGLSMLTLVGAVLIVVVWLMNVQLKQKVAQQTCALEGQKEALQKDIERRKLIEHELTQAKILADAATKAKSQFLANMTHELRTPLVGVLGMNELLLQTPLTDQQEYLADTVQRSGETLLHLVNDLLDFSKIEAGHLSLSSAPVDLGLIVEEITELFAERAATKGVELVCHVAPQACRQVLGDPLRLRQILLNLLGNAVKFTAQGKITVGLDMLCSGADAGRFSIEVRDTGIGMPAEEQKTIFAPFVQIDSTATKAFGGSGLGLAIVRQVVEAMAGELVVESKAGEGSLFRVVVTLPFCAEKRAQHPPLAEQGQETFSAAASPAVPHQPGAKPGGRLLVVDDNPVTANLVRQFLKGKGLLIDAALSGREALVLAAETNYDLILMDCNMPQMDGMEATRRLRQEGQNVPIVAMTAHIDQRIYAECQGAGMNDQLPKPFRYETLLAMIDKWLVTKGDELT